MTEPHEGNCWHPPTQREWTHVNDRLTWRCEKCGQTRDPYENEML
jgi:hypothetical protein